MVKAMLTALFFLVSPITIQASDLNNAPATFSYKGKNAVPIDISTIEIEFDFDVTNRRASAKAKMTFTANEDGYPFFDLVPNPTKLAYNGQNLATSMLPLEVDPHRVTKLRILNAEVKASTVNTLEIEYQLTRDNLSFGSSYVRAGFFMSDLAFGGREFFEQYGPANFEFDHIKYDFDVNITGTNTEHKIFANGEVVNTGPQSFHVSFPEYFTTSSVYFHLVEQKRFSVEEFNYSGVDKDYPVTVYADQSNLVTNGVNSTKRVLAELERDYGGFHHDRLVIYLVQDGGGMEHCGATMTSLWALGHELTHSWFARGVMPSSGNSGWIDEAVASWRDNNYPVTQGIGSRPSSNLGGYSQYKRETTTKAYKEGASLISEFAFLFRNAGGLKNALKEFFADYAGKTIKIDNFEAHLTNTLGSDLTPYFEKYVYGKKSADLFPNFEIGTYEAQPNYINNHPRPFSKKELKKLL